MSRERRIERLRLMKMLDPGYSQKKAASSLQISRQTVHKDEVEIKKSSRLWASEMCDGGFYDYVSRWFYSAVNRIEECSASIDRVNAASAQDAARVMSDLAPLVDGCPDAEKSFIVEELSKLKLAAEEHRKAVTIQIIQNTISTLIARCERFVLAYPVLKTTNDYKLYLESLKGQ